MPWIDDVSYAWHLPLARDLHKRLYNAYFEPAEVRTLIQSAGGPNAAKIAFHNSIDRVWVDTLERAASEGVLRQLLDFLIADGATSRPLKAFLTELVADHAPDADPGPGGKNGPDFPSEVSVPEAKLFGDDLSESVGDIPALLASIESVMRWRTAVCRLRVTGADGRVYSGTGTLLRGERVLTNHHVLFPGGTAATAVSVEFNAELDARRQQIPSVRVDGDVTSLRSDAADDWAVVTVAGAPAGAERFDLADIAKAEPDERAFILQHPRGEAKRLGFVRNRVCTIEARRVYYLTDTDEGSSGSPVFNGKGQLIALHRAGGTPQKIAGLPPVKKNEGVRIDVIAPSLLAL